MRLSNYQHISFDLDGTLINSLPVMEHAWAEVCSSLGLNVPFTEYKNQIGKPFKLIMENLKIKDEWGEIEKLYFEITGASVEKIELFYGAADLLDELKQTGKSTSLITSKPQRNVDKILKRLNLEFDVVVAGDTVAIGKPGRDAFDLVRSELNLADDCKAIYFGDVISDMIFAVNAEIDYCHCNFGAFGSLPNGIIPEVLTISSWTDLAGNL